MLAMVPSLSFALDTYLRSPISLRKRIASAFSGSIARTDSKLARALSNWRAANCCFPESICCWASVLFSLSTVSVVRSGPGGSLGFSCSKRVTSFAKGLLSGVFARISLPLARASSFLPARTRTKTVWYSQSGIRPAARLRDAIALLVTGSLSRATRYLSSATA